MKTELLYYFIGHGHIDPVWRWTWEEGFAEVVATFRTALEILKEYSDVKFSAGSAQFYEWVEDHDKELFSEIKTMVEARRWEVVGGWWIEPELNCLLGESLVRQGLYGQRYFYNKFGITASVGFNPDAFGHPGSLPQILKKQGLEYYCFLRPKPEENQNIHGHIFRWESTDGSSVLAYQIVSEYNTTEHELENRIIEYKHAFDKTNLSQKYGVFYGWGDHGGGPTKAIIDKIYALEKRDKYQIKFSTAEKYLKEIDQNIPKVSGDLQHHARGCYSVHTGIKQWNRKAEVAILTAEKAASIAKILCSKKYPQAELQKAWKKILFNQFHDILAGTSIEEAYEDAKSDFGFALSMAKQILVTSLYHISRQVNINVDNNGLIQPFIVFNPVGRCRTHYVEIEVERLKEDVKPTLMNSSGDEIEYQELKTSAVRLKERHRFGFKVDLPSLGYEIFIMDYSKSKQDNVPDNQDSTILENDLVNAEIDQQTGWLTSYYDKEEGQERLPGGGAIPIIMDDPGDTWGHDIKSYDNEICRFVNAEISVLENGNIKKTVRVISKYNNSSIRQDFTLLKGDKNLYVSCKVNWQETYKVLKLGFDTGLRSTFNTVGIPYGNSKNTTTGEEEPFQNWIDISDDNGGLALLVKDKCGYSCNNGEIRLTVLRSPVYNHHQPQIYTPEDGYPIIDQGVHIFDYCIVPHRGNWQDADITGEAEKFLFPPIVQITSIGIGSLAAKKSIFEISAPNIHISVMKQSEERESQYILRCIETHRIPTNATLKYNQDNSVKTVNFKPGEIKTLTVNLTDGFSVEETNLLEE